MWTDGSADPIQVAVKTLNSKCSESDRVKFLREAAIMGQFQHNNVVQLHGLVTEEENLMIVLEYMSKGDLKRILSVIKSKLVAKSCFLLAIYANSCYSEGYLANSQLPDKLLSFCRQIAAGLNYLTNKQFVHRDLAARNILVSSDDVCKVGCSSKCFELLTACRFLTLKWHGTLRTTHTIICQKESCPLNGVHLK